jgi:hypothetical protein
MTTRRRRTRGGQPPAAGARVELSRPAFVEQPPGQQERLQAALRTLFREHLEKRLAFSPQSSIDPSAVDAEPPR